MWGKDTVARMEEAISLTPQSPSEMPKIEANSSQEYYKYLRERTEKSPLSTSSNPFFPELALLVKKEKKEE